MNPLQQRLRSLYHHRANLRLATTTTLLAYPLGCASLLILPAQAEWVGGALLVVAVLGLIFILPSYIHRVALMPQVLQCPDHDQPLDELEVTLRRQAQAFAYRVFSLLILAGIFYMVIAADMANDDTTGSLWVPTVDDHWLAILFGVALYALMLPLFYLAWKLPQPIINDEPDLQDCSSTTKHRDILWSIGMTLGMAVGGLLFDQMFLGMFVGSVAGLLLDWILQRRLATK